MNIMRAQVVLLAAAAAAAVSACSSGGDSGAASPTPKLPATTSAAAPAGTVSPSAPAAGTAPVAAATADPNALLAAQQQLTGCKAALVPVFDAFRNGTWGTGAPQALAATPEAARPAMQQTIDYYKQILAGDPNADKDGEGSKATNYLAAFCATPDGAKLVGTTPLDALRPVKTPKPSRKR